MFRSTVCFTRSPSSTYLTRPSGSHVDGDACVLGCTRIYRAYIYTLYVSDILFRHVRLNVFAHVLRFLSLRRHCLPQTYRLFPRGGVRSRGHKCIVLSRCHLIGIKSLDKDVLKNNKRYRGRARLRSFRAAYVEIPGKISSVLFVIRIRGRRFN